MNILGLLNCVLVGNPVFTNQHFLLDYVDGLNKKSNFRHLAARCHKVVMLIVSDRDAFPHVADTSTLVQNFVHIMQMTPKYFLTYWTRQIILPSHQIASLFYDKFCDYAGLFCLVQLVQRT